LNAQPHVRSHDYVVKVKNATERPGESCPCPLLLTNELGPSTIDIFYTGHTLPNKIIDSGDILTNPQTILKLERRRVFESPSWVYTWRRGPVELGFHDPVTRNLTTNDYSPALTLLERRQWTNAPTPREAIPDLFDLR
jgi:hypothetical protein